MYQTCYHKDEEDLRTNHHLNLKTNGFSMWVTCPSLPPSLPPSLSCSLPTCNCRSITSTHRAKGAKKAAAGLPLLVSSILAGKEEEEEELMHCSWREGGREGGRKRGRYRRMYE